MFEQILKELKTKYKDLGLGESILKAYAKKIEKAVKEESEITEAVEGVEDELKIYQSFADQNRTLKAEIEKLSKPAEPKKEAEPAKPEENQKEGESVPEWAKALVESNKALSESLTKMQAEKVNQTNGEKLISKLKELGVNENFYKLQIAGKTFESDEQIEEFATTVKASEDAYLQETNNARLKDVNPPQFGIQVKEGEVSPMMKRHLEKQKTENETNK